MQGRLKQVKFIHTADWHLGKIIYSNYMTEDQRFILNKFINYLHSNSPDLLIISGDLYDRAVPHAEAVSLLNEVLSKIVLEMQIPTLIISGNHDSSERLEFLNGILSGMNLHIEGTLKKEVKKITFEDEYGPVNFYLLPYVEMQRAKELFKTDFENKTQVIEYYIDNMKVKDDERNILIAHEYVMGAEESESERPLSIGGSEYVELSVFNKFDYVALGHLHRPQRVKNESINYSGSLLKYSFSEVNHIKGMNIVKMKEKGNVEIDKISFNPIREMKIIKGMFEEIIKKNPSDNYLQIVLEDEEPIFDAIYKLRAKFPNVLSLEFPNQQISENIFSLDKNVNDISPLEIFEIFFKEVKKRELSIQEKRKVEEIFEEVIKERSDES